VAHHGKHHLTIHHPSHHPSTERHHHRTHHPSHLPRISSTSTITTIIIITAQSLVVWCVWDERWLLRQSEWDTNRLALDTIQRDSQCCDALEDNICTWQVSECNKILHRAGRWPHGTKYSLFVNAVDSLCLCDGWERSAGDCYRRGVRKSK
jgi:hypothetical protein